MLDGAAASQPDTLHFYEPTWWIINGKKVHRSHLIIFRHAEPVDVLKPQYIYGGVPLTQQIMERVYAAERVANEAPQLAMSKRTTVWLTDMEAAMSNTEQSIGRLNYWAQMRDNYGIKLGDKEGDEFQQFDTSLADFDSLIMTQYQLVAAIAGVPATKLIGTTPKGFNSTGEYEEASYHELLESIQTHDLTPLAERHHQLVIKAFVEPQLKIKMNLETTLNWLPLDSPTAEELAATNYSKAQTGAVLINSGVVSSEEERQRVATDKTSGYNEIGLEENEAPQAEEQAEEDYLKAEDTFNESDHPRAENGQFGKGGENTASKEKPNDDPFADLDWSKFVTPEQKETLEKIGTKKPQASSEKQELPSHLKALAKKIDAKGGYKSGETTITEVNIPGFSPTEDAWVENDHPRAENGQFGTGGGGAASIAPNAGKATAAISQPASAKAMANKVPSSLTESSQHKHLTKSFNPKDLKQLSSANQKQLIEIYKKAAENKDYFDETNASIAKALGGEAAVVDIKSSERAVAKILNDYEGDPSKIKDLLRTTISINTLKDTQKSIDLIKAKYGEPLKLKNTLSNDVESIGGTGYRDVNMVFEVKGSYMEVQVNMKPMLDVKYGKGHDIYEKIQKIERKAKKEKRDVSESEEVELSQLKSTSLKLYSDAWESMNKS